MEESSVEAFIYNQRVSSGRFSLKIASSYSPTRRRDIRLRLYPRKCVIKESRSSAENLFVQDPCIKVCE